MATRPGLAKSRRPSPVLITRGARVRTIDARWRDAFDAADAVSEGAWRTERTGQVWYGSTSLIVPLDAETDEERAFLAAVAERDLHVKTRALRVAVREASVRAAAEAPAELGGGVRLGKSQCEVRFAVDPRGLRIDVDVQAPLIDVSGEARRRGVAAP
jgi:hypothetical protein